MLLSVPVAAASLLTAAVGDVYMQLDYGSVVLQHLYRYTCQITVCDKAVICYSALSLPGLSGFFFLFVLF